MSTVAVKIMYNTAGSPPPYSFSYVEFYDYEVKDIPIYPRKTSQIRKLGTGKPKFRNHNGFNRIVITFNLQSTNDTASTLKKLKTLRDRDDDLFVIYYKRIDDSDVYRMCTFDRSQIPDDMAIAGMCSGGEELTVEFLEIDKTSDIVGEEAATTLFTFLYNRFVFLYNDLAHYILTSDLNLIATENSISASDFSTLFFNNNSTKDYRCLNADLNLAYKISNSLNFPFSIAVNFYDNLFYTRESGVLKSRSLTTGVLIDSQAASDVFGLYCVDENGFLWCGSSDATKIFKYAADLSSRTTYTRKISNDCPSYYKAFPICQGAQVVVLGYSDNYRIACFDIADLDGGDPIWSTVTGFYADLAIDEDGNAYVTEGLTDRYVKKYRAADGVLQWSTLGGDLLAYNKRLNAIFTTVNLYGKFNRVRQIDCVTGNVIANSAPIGSDDESKAIDGIAVSRTGEFVYAAELQNYVNTHIYCFDSGDDFVNAEPIYDTYSVGDGEGLSLYLAGDPAGHYNSFFAPNLLCNCFALDYDRKYYFCQQKISGDYYIQRRSLGCALQTTELLTEKHKILCADASGYIWTIQDTANKYIYRWNRNLKQKVTCTLKVGNALGDLINYAALSWDGVYIYLTGGADNDIVSKYDLANLDGGDPEWSVDIGSDNAGYCCVDENNDLYVGDIPATGVNGEIRKLSETDGSVTWGPVDGARLGGYFAYCEESGMLYTPYDTNKYREINAGTGVTEATTAAVSTNTWCCAIAGDGDHILCGTDSVADGAVRSYDVDLNYEDNYQVAATESYKFNGDPTGYLFKKLKTYQS